jgi:glutamine synthetase
MCWPGLPNFFPSGWHLHESLQGGDGANAFASADDEISAVGASYAAGLLEHAAAMTVLGTPTVNGMRRFRPYSFAPDRICWGLENRGVLVRLQGAPGDPGSHLENRLGEPAANPYVYTAASLAAGLDGVRRQAKPPPLVYGDPYAIDAPLLPTTLGDAVEALDRSEHYRAVFGGAFVDYIVKMKRAELARFEAAEGDGGDAVTPWEMDEYFETY